MTIDRAAGLATIRHGLGPREAPGLLARIASAVRSEAGPSTLGILPPLPSTPLFSVHRLGPRFTTWDVVDFRDGRLRLDHDRLRGDRPFSSRVERSISGATGVSVASANARTGKLLVRFNPAAISVEALIDRVELAFREAEPTPEMGPGMPVRFGLPNLNLGIAAAGQFLLPILLPVSAVLLVGTNIPTLEMALLDLKRKRLGLPVLYLAIIATTLATGQFLASALMTWFFCFWNHRFQSELTTERRRLLDHARDRPEMARLLTPSGTEVLVPVDRLEPGDVVMVASGEVIPADGRILEGEAVVDERSIRGLEGISRKKAGDGVLSGSTVLAGSIRVGVELVGSRTRLASIRRALIEATNPAPGASAPTLRSESFASRAVGPTLATAGVGLLAGDLMTVGAILRPDYATGPGLAVPFETLHKVALCSRLGIVARNPEALERLAQVNLFVLDDHPALARAGLDVAHIETRLPEDVLLRYATSAFRHLVEDRSTALVEACRGRNIPLLKLDPVDFGRGVAVAQDRHVIRVLDADPSTGPDGRLAVEVDGNLVGLIDFKPSDRPRARSAIERIRQASHVPFALVSSKGRAETSRLAASLGVDIYRGDLGPEGIARFLDACRGRGLKTAYIGDCKSSPGVAAEAHVAISLAGDARLDADPAGLLILRPSLSPLVDLQALSRAHATRVTDAQQLILIPNLLCVAGAFFFGFTGLTAVMLSNLGTLGLYRRASESLRELESTRPLPTGQPRRAG